MKAQELRIGNYVYQGSEYLNDKCTAYQIYNFELLEKGKTGVAEYYKQWKPIPLTEDWLKKFGFEKTSNNYLKANSDFFIGISFQFNAFFMFDDEGPIKYLKHVHQLQNLYFALTGEELKIKNVSLQQ